jgi:hypothetical protein
MAVDRTICHFDYLSPPGTGKLATTQSESSFERSTSKIGNDHKRCLKALGRYAAGRAFAMIVNSLIICFYFAVNVRSAF